MNEVKPNNYTQNRKLICDWIDKKNYLIQSRMLKFYVRHGMMKKKPCKHSQKIQCSKTSTEKNL